MHTRNNEVNMRSVAIVLAGNFQEEEPTKAQIKALKETVANIRAQSGIHSEAIIGHREASPDACPGKNLIPYVDQLRLAK